MTVLVHAKEWQKKTENGTFTILEFKSNKGTRLCVTCGKARQTYRSYQCSCCNNRELQAIFSTLMRHRNLRRILNLTQYRWLKLLKNSIMLEC